MHVTVQRAHLPLRSPLRTARGTLRWRKVFVLRLEVDGCVGLGEAAPLSAAGTEGSAVTEAALQTAVGLLQDGVLPLSPAGAWEEPLLGALGGAPAARHAVDGALWDLAARRSGRPLAQILASTSADRVRVNALVSGDDVAAAASLAAQQGFSVLKLKVGARPLEEDVARVAALRASAPDALLRLDANGAWASPQAALTALQRIGLERVDAIEQPVSPHDRVGLAWLRRRVDVCVAADEAVLDEATGLRLLEAEAADALVLKPMKLGGMGPCLRLAEAAQARGVRVWLTTTIDGAVARVAALHLAAAIDPPGQEAHGVATGSLLASDVASTPEPIDGFLTVGSAPGLGLDPEALRWPQAPPAGAPAAEASPE